MIRIIVADHDQGRRLKLCTHLARTITDACVFEASDQPDLMRKVCGGEYDLVVLNALFTGTKDGDFQRRIGLASPETLVFPYSSHGDRHVEVKAFHALARNYVWKKCSIADLVVEIRYALACRLDVEESPARPARLAAPALPAWHDRLPHESLSDTEFLVISMLVCGFSAATIASSLHMSAMKVDMHRTQGMAKLGCKKFGELIKYVVAHELTGECKLRCEIFESQALWDRHVVPGPCAEAARTGRHLTMAMS